MGEGTTLSISSSKSIREAKARGEFFALAAGIFAVSGLLLLWRSHAPFSWEDQRTLGREKVTWHRRADLVIVGDSRVVQGLRPAIFRAEGAAGSPLNFAFSGLIYSDSYLDQAATLFVPSGRRILLCGVAPADCSDNEAQANAYTDAIADRPVYGAELENRLTLRTEEALPQGAPLRPLELLYALRGTGADVVRRTRPTRDGWLDADQHPRNPNAPLIPAIQQMLSHRPTRTAIARVFSRLAEFERQGIEVVCFWPPSETHFREVEKERTGVTEEMMKAEAERAGLTWIEVEPGAYPTYDGVHLYADSATALSRRLARELADQAMVTSSSK